MTKEPQPVRKAVFPVAGLGTRFLPAILARFARSHPGVNVDVVIDGSPTLREAVARGQLDLTLTTVRADDPVDQPGRDKAGRIVFTEPLAWVGLEGGIAYDRNPLPLALSENGCPWRAAALAALDAAGRGYRIAYSSFHSAGQEAALLADLAVAPFPASVIEPPLQRLDERFGLPEIGDYHIILSKNAHAGPAADALADHVIDAFRDLAAGRSQTPALGVFAG